jgi:hypothetical protein
VGRLKKVTDLQPLQDAYERNMKMSSESDDEDHCELLPVISYP